MEMGLSRGLFPSMGKQPSGRLTMISFVQPWIGGLLRNATMGHAAGVVLLCSIWYVSVRYTRFLKYTASTYAETMMFDSWKELCGLIIREISMMWVDIYNMHSIFLCFFFCPATVSLSGPIVSVSWVSIYVEFVYFLPSFYEYCSVSGLYII